MLSKPLSLIAAFLAVLTLSNCSSPQKKYEYPVGADVSKEGELLEQQLASAKTSQMDVLSPHHYHDAEEAIKKARKTWEEDHNSEKSLNELGIAKSHLDQGMDVTNTAEREIPEVVQARKEANIAEGWKNDPKTMDKTDQHLRDFTSDLENGKMKISPEDRNQLERQYLGIELQAIKYKNLSASMQKIEAAKKSGADKLVPQTYSETLAIFKSSETAIETDRHNTEVVTSATAKANEAADKLTEINGYASKGAKEPVAVEMFKKNHLITKQEGMIQSAVAENQDLQTHNQELDAQKQALDAKNAALASENVTLANGASFNQVLKDAQAMFTSDEAEVYRMGDQILIRLKDIQFPTGKAGLPSRAEGTLKKVEKVMAMIGPEKVLVEGHTDDVGKKNQNMRLSEKRAETVAQYLVKDSAVPQSDIGTQGFGFDKPLTTNKTKEGRAQNRRVDILITPQSQE